MTSTLSFFSEMLEVPRWFYWSLIALVIIMSILNYAVILDDAYAQSISFFVYYYDIRGELKIAPVYEVSWYNIAVECDHVNAKGCLADISGITSIIIPSVYDYDIKGCTILTHEYYHLMGYKEAEIPRCEITVHEISSNQ